MTVHPHEDSVSLELSDMSPGVKTSFGATEETQSSISATSVRVFAYENEPVHICTH